jgi:hypothetical protein
MINGRYRQSGESRRSRTRAPRSRRLAGAATSAAFIAGALLAVVFAPIPRDPVLIDGDFSDWGAVPEIATRAKSPDPACSIVSAAAVAHEGQRLFLRVKMEGAALGAPGSLENYRVGALIDADGDASTGYLLHGMGADVSWIASGWEGRIASSGAHRFSPGAPRHEATGWLSSSSAPAQVGGRDIEASIPAPDSLGFGERTAVLPYCGVGSAVYPADAALSPGRPTLRVTYAGAPPEVISASIEPLKVTLDALGGDVAVADARPAAGSLVLGGSPATFPLTIAAGTRTEIAIRVSPSDAPAGVPVPLGLASLDAPGALVLLPRSPGKSYSTSIPSAPEVDGAFGDWTPRPGVWADDDPSDASPPEADSIDIRATASAPSSSAQNFYLDVAGDVLSGGIVGRGVVLRQPPPDSGPGPGPLNATDSAAIYVDVDGPAGAPAPLPGADYRVVVSGRAGALLAKSFESWQNGWVPLATVPVSAESDIHRLEVSVPASATGGRPALAVAAVASDWSGGHDAASAAAAGLVLSLPPVPNVIDGYITTGSPGVGINGAMVSVILTCGAAIYGPVVATTANDGSGNPGYYYVVIETDPDISCVPEVTATCNSSPCTGSSKVVAGAAQTTPAYWSINVNVPELIAGAAPVAAILLASVPLVARRGRGPRREDSSPLAPVRRRV